MTNTEKKDLEIPNQDRPSLFVNRFYAGVSPDMTRISFGETVDGTKTAYHTAIIMSTSDAKELADLILKLIKLNQAEGSPGLTPADHK